jgi:hypothetical protein
MKSLSNVVNGNRTLLRLVAAIAIGSFVGSAILPAVSAVRWALFTRPAVWAVENWTAYEYAVESFSDGDLRDALALRGRAGWNVVSARRATDGEGAACYEFVLCRPAEKQNADDLSTANVEVNLARLDARIRDRQAAYRP